MTASHNQTNERIKSLDWMRGFIMILMTIDHASKAFNANKFMMGSKFFYEPGKEIVLGQFFTRWITHLCAPMFVFLAGAALAISVERQLKRNKTDFEIDRKIRTRGLIIIGFEIFWMSWIFSLKLFLLFQVLYAIGAAMIIMSWLRKLNTKYLLLLGIFLVIGNELFVGICAFIEGSQPTIIPALLFSGGGFRPGSSFIVAYPLVPWLAMMILGWVFGRLLIEQPLAKIVRLLFISSFVLLGTFVIVHVCGNYGNMSLFPEEIAIINWLLVSKYPPSIAFTTLELGIGCLFLSGLFFLESKNLDPKIFSPLVVIGQTPLFFYLLHIHLLVLAALCLGMYHKEGLMATYLATIAIVLLLLPICNWYRDYKTRHKNSFWQYI